MCQGSAGYWINVHIVLYSLWIYSRHRSTLFWNHFITPVDKFFNFCFPYILEICNKYIYLNVMAFRDFHVSVQSVYTLWLRIRNPGTVYQELIGSWLASFPGPIKQFLVLSSCASVLRLAMIQLFIWLSVSQNSVTLQLSEVCLWSVSLCAGVWG